MQNNFEHPKMEQSKTTDQLVYSSSSLHGHKNDIKRLLPYKNEPNITN